MSATALVAAVESIDPDRLFVARALDRELRTGLASSLEFVELPFVRGRTVVPEDLRSGDLLIAGHPNHLGAFDLPAAPWIALTGRWSLLHPAEGALTEIAATTPVQATEAVRVLEAVRSLAKRVSNRRGVTVAFDPHSPVLVVLLSVDPAVVANAMALPGCTPLTEFPELPGGLRVEPPPGSGEDALAGYASALEEAIAAAEVEASNRWT